MRRFPIRRVSLTTPASLSPVVSTRLSQLRLRLTGRLQFPSSASQTKSRTSALHVYPIHSPRAESQHKKKARESHSVEADELHRVIVLLHKNAHGAPNCRSFSRMTYPYAARASGAAPPPPGILRSLSVLGSEHMIRMRYERGGYDGPRRLRKVAPRLRRARL